MSAPATSVSAAGTAAYAPSDDTLERRAALRRILRDRHNPVAVHGQIVADEPMDPALWRQLAGEVGICAALSPAELGGLDGGSWELAMIAGELAAVLYTGPFWGTAVEALPALLALAGRSPLASELAAAATAGEIALAQAGRHALAEWADVAKFPHIDPCSGGITGVATLVVDADQADVLVVAAAHDGEIGLFAVSPADAQLMPRESIDPTRRLADVAFDASPAQALGQGADAIHALCKSRGAARIAAAGEAIRAGEEALRLSVDYAKRRVQFDRPIGVHQAVKHRCADGLIALRAAKATLGYACAAADDDSSDAQTAVLAAKIAATEAFVKVAEDAIQIHGTFGYTRESITQCFFRRARWLSLYLSTAGTDRAGLAAEVLAGPARRPLAPSSELFNARMPAGDDERREPIRAWAAAHPRPSGRDLLEAGYLVPHWDPPLGLSLTGDHLLVVDQELRRANVSRPPFALARDFVAPLINSAGSAAQQQRYLAAMLSGEDVWCELFSEPEAGSDLASLKTTATRVGDEYIVTGTKTWTSQAHLARYGLLLARTDASVPRHRGISCFVVDMSAPGVTLHPILDMDGKQQWCMVFLDEVRLSVGDRIGAENAGWRIALDVLANERLSMSASAGLLWGEGPTFADLLELAGRRHQATPLAPDLQQRLARGYGDALALHVMRIEALGSLGDAKSADPDTVPEVRRALADAHGQQMLELWRDLFGEAGVARDPDASGSAFAERYFEARSLTLGGGTSEIQRNILAERVLGLPRK